MKKLVSIVLLGISFSAFAGLPEFQGQNTRPEGFDLAEQLEKTQKALEEAQRLLIFNARQQRIEMNKQELEALQNHQRLIQGPDILRDVLPNALGQLANMAKLPLGLVTGLLMPYHDNPDFRGQTPIFFGLFAAVHGLEKFSEYFDRGPLLTASARNKRDKQATLIAAAVCAGTAVVAAGKHALPKLMAKS